MKKIFTLITTLLITVALWALPAQTRLTVSSFTKSPLRVMVDEMNYSIRHNRDNNDQVVINDLRAGYHAIRIYQLRKNNKGNNRRLNNMQLIYEGNVYVRPQYHVDITINRFGKAFVDENLLTAGYDDENESGGSNTGNNGGWNQENGSQPMHVRSFEQFKLALANESYDNSRVHIAKQTISSNYFTAAQVKELVLLFNYESNKLDIAKYCYAFTLDKRNYFLVNEALTYSTSKDELARFILQGK